MTGRSDLENRIISYTDRGSEDSLHVQPVAQTLPLTISQWNSVYNCTSLHEKKSFLLKMKIMRYILKQLVSPPRHRYCLALPAITARYCISNPVGQL